MDNNIYEPLKLFDSRYRDKHSDTIDKHLDELVKKSGVNIDENQKTIKDIEHKSGEVDTFSKKVSKFKGLKVLFIVLIVFGFLGGIALIFNFAKSQNSIVSLIIGIACILIAVALIFIIAKKINAIIKHTSDVLAKLKIEHQQLIDLATSQMSPLNDLFEWNIAATLTNATIPLIEIDKYFDSRRFDFLSSRFGLWDASTLKDCSILAVLSGELEGNPYIFGKELDHRLGNKTYEGTLHITWTTSSKNGTQHHSQTLRATVTKPCPYYSKKPFLIYGNDAAPDLSFTREPQLKSAKSEKEIEKLVKKGSKKIDKKTEKAIKEGSSFTSMANTEFDVLFNAINRDHETQFRLLFTPLAQTQMLELIKDSKIGYGDNFAFNKYKKTNLIIPKHLVDFDLSGNPSKYYHYDYKVIENRFKTYNNEFFKGFYFAFAPVLSIPLYQQNKPKEFIYKDVYTQKFSSWEHESVVNNMDTSLFKHPDSCTDNIIKTKLLNSNNHFDRIEVSANGYKGINRVDYVSMRGGDGRWHNVPVPWVEYIPVEQQTEVVVKAVDNENHTNFYKSIQNNQGWQNFVTNFVRPASTTFYNSKIYAFIPSKNYTNNDDKNLTDFFKNN